MRFVIFCTCFLSLGLCASAQVRNTPTGILADNAGASEILLNGQSAGSDFSIQKKEINGVILYSIRLLRPAYIKADDSIGICFKNLAGIKGGVAIWSYAPWGIWSKPVPVASAAAMPANNVQFFYWKEKNGAYGAAVPLSGNGYRTTLGSQGDKWGSKSKILDAHETSGEIPALALAYDKNPYELFKKIYITALTAMGRANNLRSKKTLPAPFNYIGWCTWNSSNMGKDLSEDEVISGVKTFTDHHYPLGWVLVDDGWFQEKNSQLQSQQPSPKKFPNGFSNMNRRLKQDFGIKYTGIWHAFNGYWNGIDPGSELGKQYKNDLFAWGEGKDMHYFIKPGSALVKFFDSWYSYFKQQGFDFTKVDNQVSGADMARDNYPVFTFSAQVHHALYLSSDKYFNGALINCMDMVPDAYFNFGSSAVARSEEDYFPYQKDEGYNMQHGNASAHVLQAIYNSIYFSQMVYPDFDMFESDNPNAVIHAVARALNCGPVYVTDQPGKQNFDILNPLVFHDGRLAHSSSALLPTEDCLLQVQGKKIFKAFSTVGNAGLLDVFNAADADSVSGNLSPKDVNGLKGNKFLVYEHFSGDYKVLARGQSCNITLPRLACKLYYVVPLENGFAPIGLTAKYNAPSAIIKQKNTPNSVEITLYEGGLFKAWCADNPKSVLINGKRIKQYNYENNMLTLNVPDSGNAHPLVTLER
jgi:raffinose synthase